MTEVIKPMSLIVQCALLSNLSTVYIEQLTEDKAVFSQLTYRHESDTHRVSMEFR